MSVDSSRRQFDHWFLEGCVDRDAVPRRFTLKALPFRIGRNRDADITLSLGHVSGAHAELYARDGELWLRDLHSTNGTFRNGKRVREDMRVESGDVLHFARAEFVLGRLEDDDEDDSDERTALLARGLAPEPTSHPARVNALKELLRTHAVVMYFQPLFSLEPVALLGFEALGRGTHPALPPAPGPLFELAERSGLAVALSEAFRGESMRAGQELPPQAELFVNTHPSEVGTSALVASIERLREHAAERRLVVEIHEATLSGAPAMHELRAALEDLEIGLAYDDFGAGQARLLELVEVPPDYLKIDMSLVRGIDRAPSARRRMLEVIVRMGRDLGIGCVAEGIERPEELAACRDIGFDFGQGYLLGRPAPVEACAAFTCERGAVATRPRRRPDGKRASATLVYDVAAR